MDLCNCNKSEKSVPFVHCCALITIVLMKQFETLQLYNKVCLSVSLNGTHKFLCTLQHHEWKEHETQTQQIELCGLFVRSCDFAIRDKGPDVNCLECLDRESLGGKHRGCQCFGCECLLRMFWMNISDVNVLDSWIQIVLIGMYWMPMSWMRWIGYKRHCLLLQYCVLVKRCIDSKCVHEIMRCFRSMQCCLFRESTTPKVLCQIPWIFMYYCLIVM